MLEILLNMIIFGISAFLFGFAFLNLIGYQQYNSKQNATNQIVTGINVDLNVVMGICILTVFAQIFSLFSKVGALAFGFVILIDILVLLFFKKILGCYGKILVFRN
ncbi:MAG: hypothetical protein K2O59_14580 [Lachnospiraceae bacterium]|nr:hypothetical protein [Lachnospiraceae bacterium]